MKRITLTIVTLLFPVILYANAHSNVTKQYNQLYSEYKLALNRNHLSKELSNKINRFLLDNKVALDKSVHCDSAGPLGFDAEIQGAVGVLNLDLNLNKPQNSTYLLMLSSDLSQIDFLLNTTSCPISPVE